VNCSSCWNRAEMTGQLQEIAAIIAGAKRLVAFTGSGISAESGIPTFRDPGGLWDRYDPELMRNAEYAATMPLVGAARDFLQEMLATLEGAEPNPGHLALAELERMGVLRSVLTQNIDNLHTEAGNTTVIEVHGNFYRIRCLSCGRTFKLKRGAELRAMMQRLIESGEGETIRLADMMPKCQCGGLTRFDVVHFGEPVQDFSRAEEQARSCDVMLALGTSGVVTPAAFLPGYAKGSGARVIEVNATGSYFAGISDYSIMAKTGEALPQIVSKVKEILG